MNDVSLIATHSAVPLTPTFKEAGIVGIEVPRPGARPPEISGESRRIVGLWSNLGDGGGGVSSVMVEITDGRIRHGGGYRRWAAAARRDGRG
jgi:hypothetical protein